MKREQIDILFKMHADIQEMRKMQRETDKSKKKFLDMSASFRKGIKPLLGVAGIIGVTTSLTRLGRSAVETAARVDSMSKRIGVSTDFLQAWGFAARENNIATVASETALQRFTRRLGEAQRGEGVLLKYLQASNISLKTREGRWKSNEEVLSEFADAVANAATREQQLAMGAAAFDQEGVGMIAVLEDGSEALEAWIEKTREAGQMLDTGLINELFAAEKQIERLENKLTVWAGKGIGFLFDAANAANLIKVALSDSSFLEIKAAMDKLAKSAGSAGKQFEDLAGSISDFNEQAQEFDVLFNSVVELEEELRDMGRTDPERLAAAVDELERLEKTFKGINQADGMARTEAYVAVLQQRIKVRKLEASVEKENLQQQEAYQERLNNLNERKRDLELSRLPVAEQQRILTLQLAEAELELAQVSEENGLRRLEIEERILKIRESLLSLGGTDETLSFSRLSGPESAGEAFSDAGFGTFNSLGDTLVQGLRSGQDEMEVLTSLADRFFSSLISGLIQYAAQWLLTETLVKTGILSTEALTDTLRIKRMAKTQAEGASNVAAHAPGAAAASISSFGGAALIGIAALIAAMAAFGGFAEGGYVAGPGGPKSDSVPAWLSNGEYVLKAEVVRQMGTPMLDMINSGKMSPGVLPSISPGGSTERQGRTILVDNRRVAEQLKRDPGFEDTIVDIVQRNRSSLI